MAPAIVDVVVVGSGAGGATVAWTLSRAGFSVVVLEKGSRFDRTDFVHDEVLAQSGSDPFVPSIDDEPHMLVNHGGGSAVPRRSLVGWIACCVGGGTTHMGGTLQRLLPVDFHQRERFGAYEDVADWPYEYADIEEYYSQAEWLIGVAGSEVGLPAEMRRSRGFPMPPPASHPLAGRFDRACRTMGLRSLHTPRSVNSQAYATRPACEGCDYCSGHGCPVGARGGMQETLLHVAERTGLCEVRPNAMAVEVVTGPGPRATGVRYIDASGAEQFVGGSVICVSCSAVESARLLLMSRGPNHRDGLANSSGNVGRFLQFHAASGGRASFDDHTDLMMRRDPRERFLGRSLMEYYMLPDGVSDCPKGGFIKFDIAPPQPIAYAERVAFGSGGQESDLIWGAELKTRLRNAMSNQLHVDFEVFHDAIPNSNTYVELDPDVKDKWGLPVARIHYAPLPHYENAGRWLADRALDVLGRMNPAARNIHGIGTRNTHMTKGTCRAGTDPRTAVVDGFCRSHDVPNLFVVDGSFMPTSGGAPATLTIVANGLRASAYIADRARSGDL